MFKIIIINRYLLIITINLNHEYLYFTNIWKMLVRHVLWKTIQADLLKYVHYRFILFLCYRVNTSVFFGIVMEVSMCSVRLNSVLNK